MTKKKYKALSILLAVIIVLAAFPITLPTLTASATDADSYLTSPDPGVTTDCTPITWVSKGEGSNTPGNSITPANDMGFASSDDNLRTTITVNFTNKPDHQPTISCTSGGTNMVLSSPITSNGKKTYSWYVISGTASPETILEFSIAYDFNERNYVNRVYSFVRAVSQPASVYMRRIVKTGLSGWDDYVQDYLTGGSGSSYTVDFLSTLYAKNAYYSLGDFTANGYELCRATYETGIAPTNDTRFNKVASYKTVQLSGKTGKSVEYLGPKPCVDIYIDTSTASSLADMNVHLDSSVVLAGGQNTAGGIVLTTGVGNGSFDVYSVNPLSLPGNANATLGYSGGDDAISVLGGCSKSFTSNATSGTYTIALRGACTNSDKTIWNICLATIGLSLHSVDKGELRTTIEKILSGTLYQDSDPFNVFRCKNKGVNPQQWQFKNNWSEYNAAMREAMGILLKPNVTQVEINGAKEALVNAYDNLQMKPADYTSFNKYKDLAEQAIATEQAFYNQYQEHWFVPETLAALEAVLEDSNENCHILYQPQVDLWTQQLIEAYNGLRVLPADYTSLNAAVARANDLLAKKLQDGSSIYVNPTDLSAAVAAVRYDLTKADQATIAQYENNINDAIDNLVIRPADYTQVNRLKSQAESLKRSNYTNYNTLIAVLKDISKRANLKITQQDVVDADAAALQAAIEGLIPKKANYTQLETLLAQAAALVEEYYTPQSFAAVTSAVANCEGYENIDILNQSRVDALASALDAAIDGLEMYDADYSAVEAAIARWETDYPEAEREKLQEASTHAVEIAINTVQWQPKLKIDRQSEVDEWAQRINLAIDGIEYIGADYSKVEAAISKANALDKTYYADFSGVDGAIEAVNWQLGINRQDEVDAMADAILDAIQQLVPGPADYSRVNLAISRFESLNRNHYTRESVQAVEEIINSINWDLNKDNQADVITYAFDINEAIFNLVEAEADYKELNRVIANIPSNLETLYTAESIKNLNDAVAAVNWTLKAKDQATVDGYVAAINRAVEDLRYLPGDYSEVDRQIAIGRDLIENGVLQPDGTYYEVNEKSAADFEAFVANIDRSYDIVHTAEIEQIAQSVTAKYQAFKFAESIHSASIKIETDKQATYPGDTITVYVKVQTDYYAAASAIPVLYNAAYYDIVGNGAEAFTFSDIPYINGSTAGGNTLSPEKGYPASYNSTDKATWKYAYITVAPSSDKGAGAVVLDPEQVIATFQLRVKDNVQVVNDPISSRIWVDSAFLKTANNKGGKLYIGRYETSAVDTNIVGYGQTVNLTEADKTVMIYDENAPAILTQLNEALERTTAYAEDFYTQESYAVYSSALTTGRNIVENANEYTIKDQATVDEAVVNINNAYNALVLKDADVSPIEAALALTPEYSEELYTQESYLVFTNSVLAAQAILAEQNLTIVDNERINNAALAIETALGALELKPCTYIGDIYTIIDTSPMFDEGDYDADALNDYHDVFDRCDLFLASDKSILDDEEALALVNEFYDKYIALEKSALAKAIEDCSLEYDADCYVEVTYNSYVSAYNAALDLMVAEISSDEVGQIQDCVQTLKTRFNALEIKPFEYEEEVWAALDLFPQDEEHTVAESLDAYYEAYDALDLFASEKSETWTALDNAEALTLIEALHNAYNNLVIESADISELLVAIARTPENDESCYTAQSYADYTAALQAAQALTNVTYDRQDDVDAATLALNNAFDALELKPFTKLDDVNAALEAQPSLAQEAYYEQYWNAYAQALADLNEIVENADSLTVVDDAVAVEKINTYNSALAALEENGIIPEADYTAVEAAITAANTKLNEMVQTGNELVESTVDALTNAINAVDYSLNALSQETVNAYATAINAAADALEFVKKLVFNSENGEVFVDNGYIFGFENIASEEDITAVITSVGNASVVVTPSANGYGTGTTVQLVDDSTSEVLESLVIVVSADANGDGFVDAFDVAIITECINTFEDPESEAVMLASDVFADGWLDATDLAYVMYMANYE